MMAPHHNSCAASPAPDPIRFAIVGLGQHADVLASAIDAAAGAQLVAGASRSADRAAEFGSTHGIQGYDSYDDMIDQGGIDVLIVATANHLHRDLTIKALEHGINVLCEKPMALTEDDAEAMVLAAERSRRFLFVGYYLRCLDIITTMRETMQSGGIGTPLDIRAQRYSQHTLSGLRPWRRDLNQAGAGVLCDVAVHLVDLIYFVTGDEIVSVHATARPARKENVPDDHILLVLSLKGGGIATVDAARGVKGGENDFHIHGSHGRLCTGPLRWVDEHELTTASGEDIWTKSLPSGQPYAREIEGVVAALRGHKSKIATGHDGLRGVRILGAAMRSLDSGCTEKVVPTPDATQEER